MEKSPLVTIVIVNYNTRKLLLSCISSIEKWVACSYEIVVVDNDSTDGSARAVASLKKKNIKLIENKKNVGFAKANNQAFHYAKGTYILLLNSDTYLIEDCVSPCVDQLTHNPKIGVISCQLKNADQTLQPTGGYFPTLFNLFTWMTFIDDLPGFRNILHSVHPSADFYSKNRNLDWVTGAFFMFPRVVLNKLQGLDEDYFMYVEELDFCFRLKKLGYQVKYLHSCSVVHLGRASSTNEFAIQSEFKNILLFYKKHFPQLRMYAKLTLQLGCILRILFFAILGKVAQRNIYEKTVAIL